MGLHFGIGRQLNVWRRARALPSIAVLIASFVAAMPGVISAQGVSPQPATGDSAYLARMNVGYAASKAGNHLVAATAFGEAAKMSPSLATPRVAWSYELLSLGQRSEAITHFEEALRLDENLDAVRRQLGYLYADAGRNRDAIVAFAWLQTHQRAIPQDALALGNLHFAVGERDFAVTSFQTALTTATASGDTTVSNAARRALGNLASNTNAAGVWIELYLSPFYQQRFDNVVTYSLARVGVTSGGWWRPSLYASLRATRDTRSVGGQQPVLYTDNSVLPALGARVQPGGKWLTVYAELGGAYPLVNTSSRSWHRDVRAGVIAAYTDERHLPLDAYKPLVISEWYGDASWYDRFDRDVIAYGQWRESLRLLEGRIGSLDVYGRGWSAVDSRNNYYNRVVEGGGGIALHAGSRRSASVYFEGLRGRYFTQPANAQRVLSYADWRVTFVTGLYRAFPFAKP